MKRLNSGQRLKAKDELAAFIISGGDAKEFMSQYHPEDAVLINDMAFAKVYEVSPNLYRVTQADADCLPFLMQCLQEFVQARKEMGRALLQAFDVFES